MKMKILRYFISSAIIRAVLYSIPLIIFLWDGKFNQAWLLYAGNALFLCDVFIFEIYYGKRHEMKASPLYAGLAVTIIGIVFFCILAVIAIAVIAPQIFTGALTPVLTT